MKKKCEMRGFPFRNRLTKLVLMMKFTVFFLLFFAIQLSASVYSQQTRLEVNFNQATIKEVIAEIEKQTDLTFFYSDDVLNLNEVVTLRSKSMSVEDILILVSEQTGLSLTVVRDQIMVKNPNLFNRTFLQEQQLDVSGKVTDSSGAPLPGVSIVIKGTITGTITDFDGKFKLDNVSGDATLVFSFVGMKTQEIPVSGKTTIDLVMEEDAIGIEEVVAVGYGVQKKVSLTSAVSAVDNETLSKTNVSDVRKILQGQVAGLTILDRGGAPGQNNITLRIRGITSINNNDPLVIVDGVELETVEGNNGFGAINPDDIESISILKDASSTAIYGSRAANGVVLITTKRPNRGDVKVSYHGYYSLVRQNNKFQHMELEPYMRLQNDAYINSGRDAPYSEEYINEYVNATDRLKYPLPNVWQDHVYRDAPTWNHSLSLEGGSNTIQTRLSFRYKDEDGVVINTGVKQYELRSFTNYNLTDKIKLSANLKYRQMDTHRPLWLTGWGGVIYRTFQGSQWGVPRYPDGSYGLTSSAQSPLVAADLFGPSTRNHKDITGIFKAEYEIIEGLNLSAQYAYNYSSFKLENYNQQYEVRSIDDPDRVLKRNFFNNLVLENQFFTKTTIDYLANYQKVFDQKHHINVLLGYQQIKHDFNSLRGERHGFYNNDIRELSQGTNDGRQRATGELSEYSLRSYFGRINYDYKNKYLLEANLRYDGSSRFADGDRYGVFPSFSGGWRISEEGFWGSAKDVVNELKLRASWGQVGNQQVGLYTYIPTYDKINVVLGEEQATGYAQTTAVSDNLSWETTTQTNVGLDFGFLNNKYQLSVDYYHKRTSDILLTLPIPSVNGLNPTAQNAGVMDNKGWEILASTKHTIGEFGLNISATANFLENEIVDLANTGPYLQGSFIQKEGHAFNSYRGFLTDGIFQTEGEIQNSPVRWSNTAPGDLKYVDTNGDKKITDDDKVVLDGSNFPKVSYSSNVDLKYKDFTLNLMFQGVAGIYTALEGALIEMGNWSGFTHKVFTDNYWTPENTGAEFPRPYKFTTRNTDLYDGIVRKGDYFRLKNVKLAYDVPKRITNKLGLNNLNLYVSTTNLFTISKIYRDFDLDPESHQRAAEYNYPQVSTTTIGVHVNF